MKDTSTQEASAEDIVDKQATLLLVLLNFGFGICHQIKKMGRFKVRVIIKLNEFFIAITKLASLFVK